MIRARTFAALALASLTLPLAAQTVTITDPSTVDAQGYPKSVADMNLIAKDGGVIGPAPTIAAAQTVVGSTPTLICPLRKGRQKATITQITAGSPFYGNANVTTATGAALGGIPGASMDLPTSAAIYAIASAPVTVSCAEVY